MGERPPLFIAAYDLEADPEVSLPAARALAEVHRRQAAPATFFIVTRLLAQAGAEYRKVLDDDLFDLQSHTHSHADLKAVPLDEARHEISLSVQLIRETLGRGVTGLTTPGGFTEGLRGCPELLGVLREHGVRFVRSDGRGPDNTIPAPFTQPYWYSEDGFPELLELPLQYWHDNVLKGYTTAHVLWPPLPPWGLPAAPPETPEEEFAVFRQGANYVLQTGLRVYQPTLHPWSICRMSPVARQIDLLLDYVREQGMEIVACAEVHRRAREGTEPFPQAKPTHLAQDGHTWPRPSLLADAHHDARASLHPIVGFAELLATGAFGPLTPKQQEAADEILRCAERLAYGLEQLVIAEKLQARRVIARPEVLSVAAVARQVQAQARDLSGGRAEVDVVLEPGAKAVLADEERLLDITGVLVRNAVGYHPGDPRLRLTARRRGDRLEIELGDDGPGLPTGLGNRVFRPLVRGPGPPQALPPGLGLGLTIGSAMARLVGGELRLQPGPGAVFVLDLPAAEPPDSDG